MSDEGEFITAEQAIFETELAMNGLTDSGVIGKLEQGEAIKLAEYLFSDDENGLPEELRRFFAGPKESAGESITCPVCGMTSYHPKDIEEGYCGNCHDWTGEGRG